MRPNEAGAAQNQQGFRLRFGANRLLQQAIRGQTGAQLQQVTAACHGRTPVCQRRMSAEYSREMVRMPFNGLMMCGQMVGR